MFMAGLTSMPVMPWHGAPGSGSPLGRHEFFIFKSK